MTWDAVGAAHIVSVCREFTGFVDTIAAGALAECSKVVMNLLGTSASRTVKESKQGLMMASTTTQQKLS